MADVGGLGLADIDNDGDLDMAIGVMQMNAYWYEYVSADNWIKHLLGPWGEQKLGGVPYDVDQDGWLDFITGGSWYRNSGNPRSVAFTEYIFDQDGDHNMHDVALADMNNDGKKDVVVQSDEGTQGGIYWWNIAGKPTTTWTKYTITTERHPGSKDIVTADCDQIDSTGAVLYNDGHGNFTRLSLPQNQPRYGSFHSLGVVDFNGDGLLDVATVEQHDITWHISVILRWIIWS